MQRSDITQLASTSSDSGSSWASFFLIALGILLILYRCCRTQDIRQNGQIVTRLRWPLNALMAPKAKLTLRKKNPSNTLYNPQVNSLLARVYTGQEISLGVLVYCWGLFMLVLAASQLGDAPFLLSPTHTLLSAVLGCVTMIWGVLIVTRKNRNNPFSEQKVTL